MLQMYTAHVCCGCSGTLPKGHVPEHSPDPSDWKFGHFLILRACYSITCFELYIERIPHDSPTCIWNHPRVTGLIRLWSICKYCLGCWCFKSLLDLCLFVIFCSLFVSLFWFFSFVRSNRFCFFCSFLFFVFSCLLFCFFLPFDFLVCFSLFFFFLFFHVLSHFCFVFHAVLRDLRVMSSLDFVCSILSHACIHSAMRIVRSSRSLARQASACVLHWPGHVLPLAELAMLWASHEQSLRVSQGWLTFACYPSHQIAVMHSTQSPLLSGLASACPCCMVWHQRQAPGFAGEILQVDRIWVM